MAYTAAALGYLVQLSPKPIVLTGTKPIGFDCARFRQNLRDAFAIACDVGIYRVCIVLTAASFSAHAPGRHIQRALTPSQHPTTPNIADLRDGRLSLYRAQCLPEPRFYSGWTRGLGC